MTGLQAAALVLAGCLQAAALAWPLDVQVGGWLHTGQPSAGLQVLALTTLAVVLRGIESVRTAWLLSWLFATAWLSGTFWWLFISMHIYGGLAAWLAALAVLALAAALGLYYALAMAALVWSKARGVRWALLFASVWTLAELMRGQWLTGFPWGALGYAHVDSPLQVWAPWVGVYGVGWLAAAWCACLALLLRGALSGWGAGCWRGAAGVWCLVSAATGLLWFAAASPWGQWGESAGTLTVSLLQGNIAQDEKFEKSTGIPAALDWYAQRIGQAPGQLIVAPETAIALLPQELPEGYLQGLMRSLQTRHGPEQALLVGIALGQARSGYTNSVLGLDGQSHTMQPGTVYRYDKHHLVPFGEFIPPFFRWFTDMMHIPLGDFERGGLVQPPFEKFGQRLAPNICYEDLFGEELARRFVVPEQAPTVMVNLSNIGWFGDSVAIDQHLQISRMRALEFQRPMVRATNTGASVVIDHTGRVVWGLPRLQQTQASGPVQGRQGRITPYAAWAGIWGLSPLWVLCALMGVWVCLIDRSGKKPAKLLG